MANSKTVVSDTELERRGPDPEDCLSSLQAQTLKPLIVVVDNGSVDDSVALIEKRYPGVHLIKQTKNKGFAGGVNARYTICHGAKCRLCGVTK